MVKRVFIGTWLSLSLSNNIWAVEPLDTFTMRQVQLKEVSVISRNLAREAHQQAYAVSVVDLKRHQQEGRSLNRVLNSVASVRMRENGGLGSSSSLQMNGFQGNQVRVFLDGMPMQGLSLSQMGATMADRIEVYKGVLPVSLGADALGGAVNVVTRGSLNFLDANYSVGSYHTHRAQVSGALTRPNGWTLRGSAYLNYSQNDYKVKVGVQDLTTGLVGSEQWVRRFADDHLSGGLRLEGGLTGKPWADHLLLGLTASTMSGDVQTGATMDAVYGGVRTSDWSLVPHVRYKKDNLILPGLSLQAWAGYGATNTHQLDTLSRRYNWLGHYADKATAGERSLTDAIIRLRQWQASASLSYTLGEHHQFSMNHTLQANRRRSDDRRHRDLESNNVLGTLGKHITALGYQIRYQRWNANAFVKGYALHSQTMKKVDLFQSSERWEQLASRKYHIGFGGAATYYLLPSLQVKASAERAYRLPEVMEMFGDGLIQQSNPDLKPERSDNYNVGVLLRQPVGFNHRIDFEATVIWRNARDFIQKGVSLSNNPTTGFENLGRVNTRGFELSVGYALRRELNLSATFTFQDIKDRMEYYDNTGYTGGSKIRNITYGQRLPNIPYRFGSAHADYTFFRNIPGKDARLTLSYDLNYVHRYYLAFPGLGSADSKKIIPRQISHDAGVAYSLCRGRYSVMLECQNLTGALLYDNYRLQKPGRQVNLKFRYFINKTN